MWNPFGPNFRKASYLVNQVHNELKCRRRGETKWDELKFYRGNVSSDVFDVVDKEGSLVVKIQRIRLADGDGDFSYSVNIIPYNATEYSVYGNERRCWLRCFDIQLDIEIDHFIRQRDESIQAVESKIREMMKNG